MFNVDYRIFWILTAIVVVPAFIVGVLRYLWTAAEKRDGKR